MLHIIQADRFALYEPHLFVLCGCVHICNACFVVDGFVFGFEEKNFSENGSQGALIDHRFDGSFAHISVS